MGRRAKHPLRPAGRISCGIDIPEEHAPAVRAQQVSAITRLTRPLMLVNLMNAVLLIAVLRFTDQLSPPALVWGGVAAAVSLLSLLRAQPQPIPPVSGAARHYSRG